MRNPHGEAFYGKRKLNYNYVLLGCGAIGSNLATALVRQGAQHITLVDNDRVDVTNLSTTVYTLNDVGVTKVYALSQHLWAINPDVDIVCHHYKLTHERWPKFPKNDAIVIDCVDNVETRRLITARFPDALHVGIGGNYGEAIWGPDYCVPPEPDPNDIAACGIPYSLNLILVLVGLTVDMLYNYPQKHNIKLTLKPLLQF